MQLEAIQDFYLLDALWSQRSQLPNKKAADKWLEDADAWRTKLNSELALALRDYLFLASCGEARYSVSKKHMKQSIPDIGDLAGMSKSRCSVYSGIVKYCPTENLAQLKTLFEEDGWGGGMGGSRWAAIVKAIEKYGDWPDPMFIDHTVDLQHNNGTVFNKPTDDVHDFSLRSSYFMSLLSLWLNYKAVENIIDNKVSQVDMKQEYKLLAPFMSLATKTKTLFKRFLTIQRKPLPDYLEQLQISHYLTRAYKPVDWGTRIFQPTTEYEITEGNTEGNKDNPHDPKCCPECEDAYHEWEANNSNVAKEHTDDGQETQEGEELSPVVQVELDPVSSDR